MTNCCTTMSCDPFTSDSLEGLQSLHCNLILVSILSRNSHKLSTTLTFLAYAVIVNIQFCKLFLSHMVITHRYRSAEAHVQMNDLTLKKNDVNKCQLACRFEW